MKNFRDRGFTLLELMLVIVIIAIVLAVTYPSLSRGTTALRLRATGRDVLNTFRFAREKAVTEQVGMKVVVNPEKQQMILTDYLGEGKRTYDLPPDVRIRQAALAGNAVTDGTAVFHFLPNGSCDRGEVLLQSDRGARLKIVTDPITGGARIESDSEEKAR